MSDVSRGPGWWRASDRKWYPPEARETAPAAPPRRVSHGHGTLVDPDEPRYNPWEEAPTPYRGDQPGTAPPFVAAPRAEPPRRFAPISWRRPVKVGAVVAVIAGVIVGAWLVDDALRGSPQKTAGEAVADFNAGHYRRACSLYRVPRACTTDLNTVAVVSAKGLAVGQTVETKTGVQAVVAVTGTLCTSAKSCRTGKTSTIPADWSFQTAWAHATGQTPSPSAIYLPLVAKTGHWYLTPT